MRRTILLCVLTVALALSAASIQAHPIDCNSALKLARQHRARAYSNCMTAIGVSDHCHRRADGKFEEKLAVLHAFADCDREIEIAEKQFEAEAADNSFPLGRAIKDGLRRLFRKK